MPKPGTPEYIAAHIRRVLKDGGSTAHAEGVQWFFKEVITSRGWYTRELRKMAASFRRVLLRERGPEFLVAVADRLFRGRVLEEKVCAVLLLQPLAGKFGEKEFCLFEGWIARVSSWADHDALASYLLGPMMAAAPKRAPKAFVWAKSRNRWHRRAACVALIRGVRSGQFLTETVRLSNSLLSDQDDMVQKGLGWLLREAVKCNRSTMLPYVLRIRSKAPRLVLRTACETLPKTERARVMAVGA